MMKLVNDGFKFSKKIIIFIPCVGQKKFKSLPNQLWKKQKKKVANIGKYLDFLKQMQFSIINFYIK